MNGLLCVQRGLNYNSFRNKAEIFAAVVGIGVLSFLYIFRPLFSIIYHYVSHLQFLRVESSINPLSCSSVVNLTQLTTYRRNTPTDSEDSSDSNSKMSTDEEEEELRST